MPLSPYTKTLLDAGSVSDGVTLVQDFDLSTLGRAGLILNHDITALGNGHSYVDGAAVTLPLTVVAATNDTFKFNSNEYTVAPGTYTTTAALAAAINASLHSAARFDVVVTVTAKDSTHLRFTNVASGVHAEAFAVGTTDVLVSLGITAAWTIAHTGAAGSDGSASLVIVVKGKDEVSGKFYTILTAAAHTDVTTRTLFVGPSIVASAAVAATAYLPENIRVEVTAATTNVVTHSLGVQLPAG